MVHPYTPYCGSFSYRGRHKYLLTCVTHERASLFVDAPVVQLALENILRAAHEKQFELIVYMFMPDHLHLIAGGSSDDADLKGFVKLAKQYSGYYHARARERQKLWQHGSNDHIIRDDVDLLDRMRYVVNNPVAAGLVEKPEDYPFLGSQRWSVEELVARCRPFEARGSGVERISCLKAGAP